jgi:hypothetical protein
MVRRRLLGNHGCGAQLMGALARAHVLGVGEHHHPTRRALGREAYGLEELETVGVEGDVEEEQGGAEAGQLGAHIAHRPHPANVVAPALQRGDHRPGLPRLVLGEEDACGCHGGMVPFVREMGWARRFRRQSGHERPTVAPPLLIERRPRTFWSRGADAALTLVEAEMEPPLRPTLTERIRALVAAQEAGKAPGHDQRPGLVNRTTAAHPAAGDAAYCEALFVELIRLGEYRRAFARLAPECQRRWGSEQRFADAHRGQLGQLDGVQVTAIRHLDQWTDPHHGDLHREVAELEVEYGFGRAEKSFVLRRTVHLVAVDGGWRSLSYPVEAAS